MHITRAADDPEFWEAAKAVLFRAEDMIPVEGRIGAYRLPLKQRPVLQTPEMKRLYWLYHEKKFGKIVQRRHLRQPGKRIALARGPEIFLWWKDTPRINANQFIVNIGLKKPSEPENRAHSTPKRGHESDETATEQETLPSLSENESLQDGSVKPHQKTGPDLIKGLPVIDENEKEVDSTIDDIAPPRTEEPGGLPAAWQTIIEILRQEAETTVSTGTDRGGEPIESPLEFGEGDILELDAPDCLRPRTGGVSGMLMVYDWLDEDQNVGNEGLSSPTA
ncbi:hypothetical protein LTR99_010969 [Exophiala xenobiotica]|uniref:Uncharacterized protein n=1 Tax=Vermiconidia calcicola TaxID=1690605 RepID=A0AAV9QE13_9PEZI|nr:hypothetical protein LTR47_010877 [Exophiala xenobiotica]KAK5531179.1 hypothetical protein LTR23_010042 [Chaetothyriales sp. CCFEE 6169]KAK5541370.1 hypothetical protein LTR25_003147 [Vermiconidia calcicola]KAK5246964.1 hypothetical protein LTS06_007817 [Exophiala xenobiotica]KAK5261833.1 hypothetical protein LTR40_001469 [Exophiala xenobiotica]